MGTIMPLITIDTNKFEDVFGTFDPNLSTADGVVNDASSGDGIIRTSEQMQEWATRLHCRWIEAADNQLFIDIDTDLQFAVFETQVKLFKKHFYFKSVTVSPSKQGLPHRHVIIEMGANYPLLTRIAFQACLGSDPARELLSVKRAIDGESNVVVFFEKKDK
jgi:hypothetical protein